MSCCARVCRLSFARERTRVAGRLSAPAKYAGFAVLLDWLDGEQLLGHSTPPHQFNAIDTRSSLKVDFWLAQRTPFEDSMFERRIHTTLFGVEAWLASPEDVMLHKLCWNKITPSERQFSDAAGIVAVQGEHLDRTYLLSWSDSLGIADDVRRLLRGEIQPKQS